MPEFTIVKGGQEYVVKNVNNEQEAVAKFKKLVPGTPDPSAPSAPQSGPLIPGTSEIETYDPSMPTEPKGLGRLVDMATPLGSAKEIYGQLSGSRPPSALGAGLAAADIASLGLAGKVKAGAMGAKAGWQGIKQSLAGGAGAGAASFAAEEAGLPWPVNMIAGIGGGVAGGRMTGVKPEQVTKAVPKGQEAQALARTMQIMGMDVQVPKSSRPGDVQEAFATARSKAGGEVGRAKEAMLNATAIPASKIAKDVVTAGKEGLSKAGVPTLEGAFRPELSRNPQAAEEVLTALKNIGAIPDNLPPAQAMKIANNVIEGLQEKLAHSQKQGSPVNLKGPIMGGSIQGMKGALENLSTGDAVAVAKSADSAFTKMATLHDMAYKSSKTMAQEGPRFNARKFLFEWEKMDPAKKARTFSPDEVEAMDFLVSQQDPNILTRLAQKATAAGVTAFNKLGLVDLKHHPTTRFKEKVRPKVGNEEILKTFPWLGRSQGEE